jgi:formylglycine-generating enzyme required for sulfatase activity
MGSDNGYPDEQPVHEVRITHRFEMQRTEVTQAQGQTLMRSNPSHFRNCGPNCPVDSVSRDDAQQFIAKLNAHQDGYRYRLPTEAEWEYSARAGTAESGNTRYGDTAGSSTYPVAQKPPNGWGLYDMYGNVWEWVEDRYGPYPDGVASDPRGPAVGDYRVFRGTLAAGRVRLTFRSMTLPDRTGDTCAAPPNDPA